MKLSKNGHVVETSLKREAVRLVAEGYVHVNDAPVATYYVPAVEAPKPSPKPSK